MKKILVIDDDTDILELMEAILERSDFEIYVSVTMPTIEEVIQQNPSVILLDYYLSDGVGKEFCLAIKSNPVAKYIPVVIMSADNHVDLLAKESCADAYIAKPFDIDALEELLMETALG